MIKNRKIELLSPAKNVEVGIAAINHGADAVYIGPSQFGARVAAGNSVADIERLAEYAHRYYAKVYVTLNTILKDEELDDARRLVYDLYDAGVDALIVQDMALLELDLPPIALHASTQCDTRSVEKVAFFEKCGFEQVVLARETTIETMRKMAEHTNVALEAFVHGALCVCYSGQCYMSEAMRGRSANRGACAQMCRLPYNLINESGEVLVSNKHLLSLKDFDASRHLKEMIDAGISSFKIEGRLKDVNYVKNITAYYRKRFDDILVGMERRQASSGKTIFFFDPNPKKTFYRGATDYFLDGRKRDIWSFDTPKSMGEPIGKVKDIWRNAISVNTKTELANGDGLCFLNSKGEFEGFRVNRVEGNRLLPLKMPKIEKGTLVYRNADAAFEKILAGNTSERRIDVAIAVRDLDDGFEFVMRDDDGVETRMNVAAEHESPKNIERAMDTWKTQLGKLGGTIFESNSVDLSAMAEPWFVPVSRLAEWRRALVDKHESNRRAEYKRSEMKIKTTEHKFITDRIDYRGNVYNYKAKDFYEKHGCSVIEMAFEKSHNTDAELMRTKHCIRYAMGWCNRENPKNGIGKLFLQNGNDKFELLFDCKNCEMVIKKRI